MCLGLRLLLGLCLGLPPRIAPVHLLLALPAAAGLRGLLPAGKMLMLGDASQLATLLGSQPHALCKMQAGGPCHEA